MLAIAAALAPLLFPAAAQACSVCFSGNGEESRMAFLVTTVFMTVLPLTLIGGVVWWMRRRVLLMEREQASRAPVQPARLRPVA